MRGYYMLSPVRYWSPATLAHTPQLHWVALFEDCGRGFKFVCWTQVWA